MAKKQGNGTPGPISNELVWLGSRDKLHAGNPIQIREATTDLRKQLKIKRKRDGEDGHEIGTTLTRLYKVLADQVFGHDSFLVYARRELGLGRTSVYRYTRLARYATLAQAAWGIETCLAAATLLDVLQENPALRAAVGLGTGRLKNLSDLSRAVFPLEDGRKLRLTGTEVAQADVEEALDLLRTPKTGEQRLPAKLRRSNQRLRAAVDADPELRGVEARFVVRRGKARLNVLLPAGANLSTVARALERALEEV